MSIAPDTPRVIAVSKSPTHTFSKPASGSIGLIAGLGVEGDAHFGETVKHRSRVRADPTQPNLRQIHLIHRELIDSLKRQGFRVDPGVMGENITTAAATWSAGKLFSCGASVLTECVGGTVIELTDLFIKDYKTVNSEKRKRQESKKKK